MTRFRRARLVSLTILLCHLAACSSLPRAVAAEPEKPPLAARLDEVLRRGRTGPAVYGARVIDLKTGKELYAVDPDKPLIPASNGKLAVSAATLDFFGPKATFKTYLALDGDDLWIIGTGDPGIGDHLIASKHGRTTMSVLDDWTEALAKRGIKTIKGNLYYYDRTFDDEWICPSWSKGYVTEWYAAPISGLNFNNNCVDISIAPTESGKPVTYTIKPPTQDVKVTISAVTGKGDDPDVSRQKEANVFIVSGATTRPMNLKSEAVTNPGAFFADALRTHLQSKSITIDGPTRRADQPLGGKAAPPRKKIVAVHETSMPDAIGRVNKQSQNNFAEAFAKMLGRAYRQKQGRDEPGSWQAGAEAAKAFLTRNRIDTTGIVIADGSGLSRENRVTPRMISDLLASMWKHRYKKTFFDSLAVGNVDGTIKERFSDLKDRVHAKTGFIGGVRSLSGYVQNDDGRWIVFSIIYNGFDGSAKPYERLQDNAVRVLAASPKQIELPATREASTRTTTTTSAR